MKALLISVLLLVPSLLTAQPALSVLTVHTEDKDNYHQWMRKSGPVIGKSIDSMALGVCDPIRGAEDPHHLYAWSVAKSHSAVMNAMDNMGDNPAVVAAVKDIASQRQIQFRDLWSVVQPPKNAFTMGNVSYNWHVMVKTTRLNDYVKALNAFIKDSEKAGFGDIDMAVYLGNSGKYAGTTMVVAYAPSAARLGDFFDQRFSPWSMKHMSKFNELRTMAGAFIMRCETVYAAQ